MSSCQFGKKQQHWEQIEWQNKCFHLWIHKINGFLPALLSWLIFRACCLLPEHVLRVNNLYSHPVALFHWLTVTTDMIADFLAKLDLFSTDVNGSKK